MKLNLCICTIAYDMIHISASRALQYICCNEDRFLTFTFTLSKHNGQYYLYVLLSMQRTIVYVVTVIQVLAQKQSRKQRSQFNSHKNKRCDELQDKADLCDIIDWQLQIITFKKTSKQFALSEVLVCTASLYTSFYYVRIGRHLFR